jgi:hypothetical protein
MKFETVKDLGDEKFRRLTGIKKPTFDTMVNILDQSIKTRKATSGRKRKLSLEDSLLMQQKRPLKDQKKAKAFLLRKKEKAHPKDPGSSG